MPDINATSTVSIIYPAGLEVGGSAEFLTHDGKRAHTIEVANGTNVDFGQESATTVYDVRIEERPVDGIIKYGFSTEHSTSVGLEAGDESWTADFGALVDAKDVAVSALRKQTSKLGGDIENLWNEVVDGRRFVRISRRVLLSSVVAFPATYVLAEKVNDLFELGYFPAGVVAVLSFINLLGESSGLRQDERSRDAKVIEKAYLEESVEELNSLSMKLGNCSLTDEKNVIY